MRFVGNIEAKTDAKGRILCLYIKSLCLSSHSVSVLQYIAK